MRLVSWGAIYQYNQGPSPGSHDIRRRQFCGTAHCPMVTRSCGPLIGQRDAILASHWSSTGHWAIYNRDDHWRPQRWDWHIGDHCHHAGRICSYHHLQIGHQEKEEIWTLDTNCFLISTKQKQLCQFKQSVLYIFRNLAKRNKRAYFSVKLYKATKQFPVFLSPTAALCDVSSVFGEKAETEPQNMWPASTNQRPVSGSRDHFQPMRSQYVYRGVTRGHRRSAAFTFPDYCLLSWHARVDDADMETM